MICAGTEGGAIYAYGDGFQYMRPWLSNETNAVTHIVSLHPNRILVGFSDNNIAVLDLPSLNLLHELGSSWIKGSDITAIYTDEAGERNFVFVGTSDGLITVLDTSDLTSIRVCNYSISWKMMSLPKSMAVSDIQLCPKDERYLAVGLEGPLSNIGALVIFDLVKQKPLKVFETAAIASICWQHHGDVLFAGKITILYNDYLMFKILFSLYNTYIGTKNGKLLSITSAIEKPQCITIWNAQQELASYDTEDRCNENDDTDNNNNNDDDVSAEGAIVIVKIHWMAAQSASQEGCLFLLLCKIMLLLYIHCLYLL